MANENTTIELDDLVLQEWVKSNSLLYFPNASYQQCYMIPNQKQSLTYTEILIYLKYNYKHLAYISTYGHPFFYKWDNNQLMYTYMDNLERYGVHWQVSSNTAENCVNRQFYYAKYRPF